MQSGPCLVWTATPQDPAPVWTVSPGPCAGLDSEPRMSPTLALLPAPSWAGPQSAETEGLQASPPLPALVLITLSSSAWSPLGGTCHSDTCPQPWGPTPVPLLQPLGGPVLPSGWARRGRGHWAGGWGGAPGKPPSPSSVHCLTCDAPAAEQGLGTAVPSRR